MRSTTQLALVAVAGPILTAGLLVGVSPVTAPVPTLGPGAVEVVAPCGIGYLPAPPTPATGQAVPIPGRPAVSVSSGLYAERCAAAGGGRRVLAWALSAVGLVGLALIFVGRSRVGLWRVSR